MHLQFRPAIILLCICISISACGSGNTSGPAIILPTFESSNPTSISSNGLCGNTLSPATQGAAWTYTSSGGPSGSFNYTNSITSTRADGFTLTTQFTDRTSTQEWACQADGLKALQLGGGSGAGISIQSMTTDLVTSEITGISLPKDITSGMQWQYNLSLQGTIVMPGDSQAPSNGTYSVVMQEIGSEIITVPAGTFEAVKIQSNSTVDIISVFGGIEVPIKFNGTTITWYAPGVGYVKSVENGDFGGTVFSAVTELQSYRIP